MLHSFDALILNVDLVILVTLFSLFHVILSSLVHLLLLLLDGLSDGGLLFWVQIVEVGKVFLIDHLLLLLSHGHLVVSILIHILLILILVFILVLFLVFIVLIDHLGLLLLLHHELLLLFFIHLILVLAFTIIVHLFVIFFIDVLLDLIGCTFHQLLIHAFSLVHHLGSAFLHEGLAAVLSREVRSRDIESIVVLSGDK